MDERIGSKDLIIPLQRAGVPAEAAHLEAGDFAFVGRGINDAPITVGIELKRIRRHDGRCDLIESLKSDRFAGHQLIGMQSYDRPWLITEGLWRESDDGTIEVYERGSWVPLMDGRKYLMMGEIQMRLMSLLTLGGLAYWHCATTRDTVRFLSVLYRWWTNKALDDHRSHQAIYLPPPDRALMVEPGETLKMMSCLPGVGWDRAGKLDAKFTFQIVDRVTGVPATSNDLQAVHGVGKTTADRITQLLWSPEHAA